MQKDGLGVVYAHNLIYLSFCYNVDEIYCVSNSISTSNGSYRNYMNVATALAKNIFFVSCIKLWLYY